MTTDYLKEQLHQAEAGRDELSVIRAKAIADFERMGIPGVRNEEWKYTRISSVFNKEYHIGTTAAELDDAILSTLQLPGHDEANVLFFINGVYSEEHSLIRSEALQVMPLETAAESAVYSSFVTRYLNHSAAYLEDGMHALNTAFIRGGIYLHVPERKAVSRPLYIYHIADARTAPVLAQPRSLMYIGAASQLMVVETYVSIGTAGSMTNQVMEIAVEQDALLEYYKIQNDSETASQVSTLHIQQVGKSAVNVVTVSLNGAMIRNNLHAILDAAHTEAHLYGLYIPKGNTHIDNHTVVDNAMPGCLSNELYKGILDGNATGVFNGKVFVRKDAQKINAFQSNKNILLSDTATVNTKPQLEIFADDVKCSHGCTIGCVDEEALFYLQSRGIPRKEAMTLLLQGFAVDVLDKIKHEPVKAYVASLIVHRLTNEVI